MPENQLLPVDFEETTVRGHRHRIVWITEDGNHARLYADTSIVDHLGKKIDSLNSRLIGIRELLEIAVTSPNSLTMKARTEEAFRLLDKIINDLNS